MHLFLLRTLLFGFLLLPLSSNRCAALEANSFKQEAKTGSSPLVIVSWNMQWLSTAKEKSVISRTAADFRQLKKIISNISPDILAFQEVDSAKALIAILPDSKYTIYLSDRQHKPSEIFPANNQFTGFAVRSDLVVRDPPDLGALNVSLGSKPGGGYFPGKLRYGSYLIVKSRANTELHLLNVHLKSGCFSRRYRQASKPCRILKRQSDVLAAWIRQRQINNDRFLLLGDFNHQLNSPNQWMLSTLNKELTAPIASITDDIAASCTVKHTRPNGSWELRHYRALVDHIVSSKSMANSIRRDGRVYQYRYNINNVKQFQLPDHCPLVLHLPDHPI